MKYGALFGLATIVGSVLMSMHWNAIDQENNAFAKDCNDRGGEVRRDFDMRQCIVAPATSGGGNAD